MNRRLWSIAFALALLVALAGGGCATGSTSGSGLGDDSGLGNGDGSGDGGCPAGQQMCGATCADTGTDNANCGMCGNRCPAGQVCSGGKCGYSCMPPETLCGGPGDAGGHGGGKDASMADSGGADASSEGGGSSGGSSGGGSSSGGASDGGATQPYCANLGNDPNNCGTCGDACAKDHVCNSGKCGLMCGAGQRTCITSDSCIPANTCCNSSECLIMGEVCPSPGSTCQCPNGEKECNAIKACISSSDCCTNADCTVQGSSCPTPGQPCQCGNGMKACNATNSCIPQTDCCTPTDCQGPPNVQMFTCTMGTCGIGSCNPGCYHLTMNEMDGCECCDDPLGKMCSVATGVGPIGIGGNASETGKLPGMNEEDWLQVTFNGDNNNKSYHPHITFSANPNGEFAFDIYGSCGGAPIGCGEGGSCSQKTDWEVFYGATMGNPGDPNWAPLPAVGTVFVRVYRVAGGQTCDQWTLAITG
jgi:hypothetical protein